MTSATQNIENQPEPAPANDPALAPGAQCERRDGRRAR
jgi:hypothetical protein